MLRRTTLTIAFAFAVAGRNAKSPDCCLPLFLYS